MVEQIAKSVGRWLVILVALVFDRTDRVATATFFHRIFLFCSRFRAACRCFMVAIQSINWTILTGNGMEKMCRQFHRSCRKSSQLNGAKQNNHINWTTFYQFCTHRSVSSIFRCTFLHADLGERHFTGHRTSHDVDPETWAAETFPLFLSHFVSNFFILKMKTQKCNMVLYYFINVNVSFLLSIVFVFRSSFWTEIVAVVDTAFVVVAVSQFVFISTFSFLCVVISAFILLVVRVRFSLSANIYLETMFILFNVYSPRAHQKNKKLLTMHCNFCVRNFQFVFNRLFLTLTLLGAVRFFFSRTLKI